jgi:hypothetical protein
LRPGNVQSADGWEDVLKPVMARYAKRDILCLFRADAAFAIPALYNTLEAEGYLIRDQAADERCAAAEDCARAQAPSRQAAELCAAALC